MSISDCYFLLTGIKGLAKLLSDEAPDVRSVASAFAASVQTVAPMWKIASNSVNHCLAHYPFVFPILPSMHAEYSRGGTKVVTRSQNCD